MFMKKERGRENMRETKRDREMGADCMNLQRQKNIFKKTEKGKNWNFPFKP